MAVHSMHAYWQPQLLTHILARSQRLDYLCCFESLMLGIHPETPAHALSTDLGAVRSAGRSVKFPVTMWRVCETHIWLVADVCIVGHQTVWGPV